ncbi:unnamed protein product [Linum tenue]|uniref:Regulator of Vps4 activity in the MVB pathway protein n=1 Tax=Linum tenue TaxID=586396 RepID=A0AAV0KNG3_9ROSI|nr:unnamed protein product [Linum tenue]
MFDSLTKSKFYTKCKSLTKMTKVRLDATRKKKNAVAKYLKNDIADLLRTGLDSNAYGRADGLIVEQNMIAAYKLMEEFCECILTNLAALDKQKECPKECREAIQSLMYAAAWLAEFPELRDLRSLFAQRYGDYLELFLNKEFSELLNPKPASKEMKLQLLRDVAQEFSIKWDSKFLEQKLFRPPHSPSFHRHDEGATHTAQDVGHKVKINDAPSPRKDQDIHRESKNRHREDGKRNNHGSTATAEVASSPRRKDVVDGYRHNRPHISESESTRDQDIHRDRKYKHKEVGTRESHGSAAVKAEVAGAPRRKDVVDDRHNRLRMNSQSDSTTDHDSSKQPSSTTIGTSTTSASEDEVDSSKKPYYRFIPPPYVRAQVEKKEDVKIAEESPNSRSTAGAGAGDKESESQPTKPRSVRRRQQMKQLVVGDDSVESPLKLPPGRSYFGSVDSSDGVFGGSNNKGTLWNYAEEEEEERKLDELLMKHSKKRASYERGSSNNNNMKSNNKLKPLSWRSRDESGKDAAPGSAPPFGKSASSTTADDSAAAASSSSGGGIGGRHGRSLSAESSADVCKSKHVHPNLPDYDLLAARIAAFMRK